MHCEMRDMAQCRKKWENTRGEMRQNLILGLQDSFNKRQLQTDISLVLIPPYTERNFDTFNKIVSPQHHFMS